MTRKELEEMGLDEEQVNKLMDLNGKAIEKIKKDRDEAQSTVLGLQEELTKRETDFEELKKSSGASEELRQQLESKSKEYEEYKANAEKRETEIKEKASAKLVTAKLNPIDEKSFYAHLDFEKARSHEKGFEEGLLEQGNQIKEDLSFLFPNELNGGLSHKRSVPKEKEVTLKEVLYPTEKKEG